MQDNVPKLIFIVPYRDREFHRNIFYSWTNEFIEKNNFLVIFSHQNDKRLFNRGGIKNLGFIYIKEKYPEHYKDIVFVFHDVDLLMGDLSVNFFTEKGMIKHFFGFKKTLGGAFSITGEDFEKINGFPCYWTWGYEDNALYQRWRAENNNKVKVDYSHFCDMKQPYWFKKSSLIWHGDYRIINKKESSDNFKNCLNTSDGIKTTKLIKYSTNNFKNKNYLMLNITEFSVLNKETKNAVNEKLTKKERSFIQVPVQRKRKNFNQFPIPKKINKVVQRKIFSNLIGK